MSKWRESYRLTIFVPLGALEAFITAVGPQIPSFLGSYDHVCWWGENGTEQSRKIGGKEIRREPCVRFECSLPRDKDALETFIETAVKPAHPWEEPVILIQEDKILLSK